MAKNWLDGKLFEEFQNKKISEKDSSTSNVRRSDLIWPNPDKGTVEQAKVYEGRFLQDPKGVFYKKYFYHMWKSGENWIFVLCPKTEDWKCFCPFCAGVNKLYNGTQQDKSQAYSMKRKEKFSGNWYVVKDGRDEDRDEDNKMVGKVKIYDFPGAVEKKLKKEICDKDQGYGKQIFDPGENGRNLILRVSATKKQKNGEQYPEYSNSEFSRQQSALGTDEEIKEIMDSRIDVMEYINSRKLSQEEMVEILKSEFIWDMVEDECIKNGYKVDKSSKKEEKKDDIVTDDDPLPWDDPKDESSEESSEESDSSEDSDDMDDNDLLKELDDL